MSRFQTRSDVVDAWLADKGVSVWPSVSADLSDTEERRKMADWFLEQLEDLESFVLAEIEQRSIDQVEAMLNRVPPPTR